MLYSILMRNTDFLNPLVVMEMISNVDSLLALEFLDV